MLLLLGLWLVLGLLLLVGLGLLLRTDWGRLMLLLLLEMLDWSWGGESLFAGALGEAGIVESGIVRTIVVVGSVTSVVVLALLRLVGLGLVLTVLGLLLVLWLGSVLWWRWWGLRQMVTTGLETESGRKIEYYLSVLFFIQTKSSSFIIYFKAYPFFPAVYETVRFCPVGSI